MVRELRWRLLFYAALLLVPLVVGGQVYRSVGELSAEIDTVRHLTAGGDDTVRLEVEYYRMRDGLERFVTGDPEMDFDEAKLRFDIVWSRTAGIKSAPNFLRFQRQSDIVPVAAELLRVLQVIEPKVQALERGDMDDLADIRRILVGFEQDLASSALGFAQRRQQRGVEVREDLSQLVGYIGHMSIAVAVVFFGILLMFTFEAFHARRAEFDVRRREQHARHLAHHDALTGLGNRTLLAETMKTALRSIREGGDGFQLLALDLDGFKAVNDTHGHQTGDELLKVIADRLTRIVKGTDLVARLGGDEFAVVLTPCSSGALVSDVARRMIDAVERPIKLGNNKINLSTSIGIASAPSDGDTDEALLRCADVALYAAKAAGRRTFRFFMADMDAMLRRRLHLEAGLRQAIDTNDLDVHFQPQVDLSSGRVFGVEALLRWADPSFGPIPSKVCIDIADQCGLMQELGARVLEFACRHAATWRRRGLRPQLAINLSAAQLHHRDFIAVLDETLRSTGFPSEQLILEITEDALINRQETTSEILASLQQRGVKLAIDDFGTGFSNLAHLKRLPIQYLKIDRTLVKDIEENADNRAIVKGITGLADSLGLDVIAEGVETECQREFLLASGCSMAQGFLFRPALPEDEILAYLEAVDGDHPDPVGRTDSPELATLPRHR